MRRRGVLAGALAALGLAGCAGGPPAADPSEPASGSEPAPGPGIALVGTDLRVGSSDCGRRVDEARVSFDPGAPAVAVEGTVWGSDTCHTARLVDAAYDPATDRLVVRVAAARRASTGTPACGQCIVEIGYAATCSFDGGLPGTVRVVHGTGSDARVVATARR
jgi:hypothetical protein